MKTAPFSRLLQGAVLALLVLAGAAFAEIPEERRDALDAAVAATVHIKAIGHVKANMDYGSWTGTGYIVARTTDRLIVATNCHVACEGAWLMTTPHSDQSQQINAKFITGDEKQDIAYFSVPIFAGAQTLELMDGVPDLGERAVAIGGPFGLRWTVTVGVFSVINRGDIDYPTPNGVHQTDAAINPGNSGGPLLVWRDGRYVVAGMNTFIHTNTRSNIGLGFAVPASDIRRALNAVLKGQTPRRNTLGALFERLSGAMGSILGIPQNYQRQGVRGLFISSVPDGSPAQNAGLQVGDILLEVNSTLISSRHDYLEAMSQADHNVPVRVRYARGGGVKEGQAFVANDWGQSVQTPAGPSAAQLQQIPSPLTAFGFAVIGSDDPLYKRYNRVRGETLPTVTTIVDLGAAHYAGIKRGFYLAGVGFPGVAPKQVADTEELRAHFAQAEALGVDTSKAVFIFKVYGRDPSTGQVAARLIPVLMDAASVPPPA